MKSVQLDKRLDNDCYQCFGSHGTRNLEVLDTNDVLLLTILRTRVAF